MKKILKIIILLLLVFFGYYLLSKFCSKNNDFIQTRRYYSVNIDESMEWKLFMYLLDYSACQNTKQESIFVNKSIWVEKSVVRKYFGIIPIPKYIERNSQRVINFGFNEFGYKYNVSINDNEIEGGSFSQITVKGDTLNIDIQSKENKLLVNCDLIIH